jgi:RND family efflux transporter MFP subunit
MTRDRGPVAPVATTGQPASTAVALTVALIAPQEIRWADEVTASGAITAWQEALVSAEVSGLRLSEINVDVGDQVKRGQVLARFDDAMMQSAVTQQRALVEQAEARLAEADAYARRAQSLRKTGAISEQDLIQFVTRDQAAEAELKSAKARLESSDLNLKFTTVVAPDDGVISARSAMLGAVAAPGAELFRLVRQNRLEWRAELTGAQLLRVSTGQRAELTLPDGSTAVGTVRQVAPVLDTKSRTGVIYVELDRTQSPSARAGMFASGVLVAGEREGIAVPASSVVLRDGHQFVFVVGADTRVEAVKVQTGRREGELVEITEGIDRSQRIVGAGASFLNSGDPVRVVTATDAAQG